MPNLSSSPGLFITGTDTGVGKTIIAAGLAAVLKGRGIDVGVMKPVETGCALCGSELVPQDALFLKSMAQVSDELEIVNPYRFEKPLAPWVAAEQERKEINLERLRESFERLKQRHEFLIVEGVGGLLVPLTAHHLISDVAQLFQLPLVVVAKAGLGTINHTLLTIRQAQILELAILGVIINNPTGETGPAEETNPQVLPRLITVPLLGVVPYCSELKGNNTLLKRLIEENVDLRGITRNFAANYSCGGIPR